MEEQGMFGDMAYSQQPTPNPAAGGYTQEQVDGKPHISIRIEKTT